MFIDLREAATSMISHISRQNGRTKSPLRRTSFSFARDHPFQPTISPSGIRGVWVPVASPSRDAARVEKFRILNFEKFGIEIPSFDSFEDPQQCPPSPSSSSPILAAPLPVVSSTSQELSPSISEPPFSVASPSVPLADLASASFNSTSTLLAPHSESSSTPSLAPVTESQIVVTESSPTLELEYSPSPDFVTSQVSNSVSSPLDHLVSNVSENSPAIFDSSPLDTRPASIGSSTVTESLSTLASIGEKEVNKFKSTITAVPQNPLVVRRIRRKVNIRSLSSRPRKFKRPFPSSPSSRTSSSRQKGPNAALLLGIILFVFIVSPLACIVAPLIVPRIHSSQAGSHSIVLPENSPGIAGVASQDPCHFEALGISAIASSPSPVGSPDIVFMQDRVTVPDFSILATESDATRTGRVSKHSDYQRHEQHQRPHESLNRSRNSQQTSSGVPVQTTIGTSCSTAELAQARSQPRRSDSQIVPRPTRTFAHFPRVLRVLDYDSVTRTNLDDSHFRTL